MRATKYYKIAFSRFFFSRCFRVPKSLCVSFTIRQSETRVLWNCHEISHFIKWIIKSECQQPFRVECLNRTLHCVLNIAFTVNIWTESCIRQAQSSLIEESSASLIWIFRAASEKISFEASKNSHHSSIERKKWSRCCTESSSRELLHSYVTRDYRTRTTLI